MSRGISECDHLGGNESFSRIIFLFPRICSTGLNNVLLGKQGVKNDILRPQHYAANATFKWLFIGASGWLSQLSIRLLILAQAMTPGSWDLAPHQSPYWAWSLLKILSLPLSLPLSLSLSLSLPFSFCPSPRLAQYFSLFKIKKSLN